MKWRQSTVMLQKFPFLFPLGELHLLVRAPSIHIETLRASLLRGKLL